MANAAYTARTRTISVVKEFSDEPFGRFETDGPNNGSRFRTDFLIPALEEFDAVTVDLSGAFYGSSWLEEVFGGLVRYGHFDAEHLHRRLEITHPLPSYVSNSWDYIDRAEFGHDAPFLGEA